MNNKQLYKDTFEQLKLSEEALTDIKMMNHKHNRKRFKKGFKAAVTAVSLMLMFVLGNAVAYAVTGGKQAVVEKETDNKESKMLMMHDDGGGDPEDPDLMTWDLTSDDMMTEEMEIDEDIEIIGWGWTSDSTILRELKQEGERIYLIMKGGEDNEKWKKKEKKIDITEDFSDGKAVGTFEMDGVEYHYAVTGTVEDSKIVIVSIE